MQNNKEVITFMGKHLHAVLSWKLELRMMQGAIVLHRHRKDVEKVVKEHK